MIDFGLVDAVDAEAIGVPGQRRFRLRARAGDNYAALWMEKEQLLALGRGFSQILADRSRRRGQPADPVDEVGPFPQTAQIDMQIARMGLDFDQEQEHVVLLADDPEAMTRGDSPMFRMELSRAQAIAVIRVIERTVAAGRPLCPLCKQPMEGTGKHFCPPSNGHSAELALPDIGDDDEEDDEDEDDEEDV